MAPGTPSISAGVNRRSLAASMAAAVNWAFKLSVGGAVSERFSGSLVVTSCVSTLATGVTFCTLPWASMSIHRGMSADARDSSAWGGYAGAGGVKSFGGAVRVGDWAHAQAPPVITVATIVAKKASTRP